MMVHFGAQPVVVSCPEFGLPAKGSNAFGTPVMVHSELLSKHLLEGYETAFTVAVDFAGSSSGKRCHELEHSRGGGGSNIADGFWFQYWRGKVKGALTAVTVAAPALKVDEKIVRESQAFNVLGSTNESACCKVVIAVSISGGPISQVERAHVPDVARSALSDLRRRRYDWVHNTYIAWVHFESIEDMLNSMEGQRNLVLDHEADFVHKDCWGKNLAFVVTPSSASAARSGQRGASVLRRPVSEILAEDPSDELVSWSGFHNAIFQGDSDAIDFMIAKDRTLAKRSVKLDKHCTVPVLTYAAFNSPVPKVVETIIDVGGVDVNAKDGFGDVPLSWAVWGKIENARVLIKKGADPERPLTPGFIEYWREVKNKKYIHPSKEYNAISLVADLHAANAATKGFEEFAAKHARMLEMLQGLDTH
eukprot:TRINITY_DN8531_c1_g1_i1.p1 TRINITY_DN8531_c1_g1~~TRINITY_DN8531_c1_g1_i1.p1  ORF type:complete len:444 (-),score=73.19 TRINITY_DN8531_c1_g1_i1:1154-2413(-)